MKYKLLNLFARFNNKEMKNAGWLISGRLIQMVLSFVISILTARYLGPANYGIINYAVAYVIFFTSLCTLGIDSVIIKNFVEQPEEQGETIGTTLALRALSSIMCFVAIIVIVYLVDRGETTTIYVTVLCSIALLFQIFDTFNYWFQNRYESKVTAISILISYLVTSVYKIFLLICNKDIYWFACANALESLCLAIGLLLAYRSHGGPHLSFSFRKAGQLLKSSYHYILSGMMIAIYGQTDKLMLKQMLGETEVGYYSLATSLNSVWVFILMAFIDSFYPTIVKLYQIDKEKYEKKNIQLYSMIIYMSVVVAVFFILFGKLVIGKIYGDAYLPAVGPLRIVTGYTIFAYLGVARNAWIVCENKQKYLKYMYFIAAIMNVGLNCLLIPIWGASGAALASLLTQIGTSFLLPLFIPEMRKNVVLMLKALKITALYH